MSAAHDDREPVEHMPSTDVSEAEAEAIASQTSADQTEDAGLVAPTTGATGATPSTAAAGEPADTPRVEHEGAAEPDDDRRHLQQGSGQASPSFGEQQQRVPPRP